MTKRELEQKIEELELRIKILEARVAEGSTIKEIHHHYHNDQPLLNPLTTPYVPTSEPINPIPPTICQCGGSCHTSGENTADISFTLNPKQEDDK